MDNYLEDNRLSAPVEAQPEQYEAKPSPFADSPYETFGAPSQKKEDVQEETVQETAHVCSCRKSGVIRGILSAVLVLVVVISCCGITASLVNSHWEQQTALQNQVTENRINALQSQLDGLKQGAAPNVSAPVQTELMTPGQVYSQNVRAVVAISNQATTNFYGQVSETASSGSGFIISADGYVVSNYHVVEGATKLTVLTSDGTEYNAKLIGYDVTNDISLLKIEAENLPFVKLGSSDALAVGDQVVAIGNPLGELTSTLTVGYVSAKDRVINTDGTAINMLQTDAAINSGNSGGPLFNMRGEVIGITTAKYSGASNSGAYIEGIGFAIPMDDVEGMLSDLKEYGYVTGAYLGVSVKDVDPTAQAYGLPAGAYVQEVIAGSAAEKAGIKAKDIIVNLGGHKVESLNDLTRALRKVDAGQETTVSVYRAGQQVNLRIIPDEKPRQTQQETVTQPTQPSVEDFWNQFGYMFPFFD